MKLLVTGAAGFIGYHVTRRLLDRGDTVVGLDNLNPYYDVALKEARLARLVEDPRFEFARVDLADDRGMRSVFDAHAFDRVLHLAAQAGVRYSLTNPDAYIQSNLVGFSHLLEECRRQSVAHLVYASSSSVYGTNTRMPFSTHDGVDHPISLYAATKKANEMMAHAYSHLFRLPTTGLRFFSVYGPWGRPDMAMFIFAKAIVTGTPIRLFNHGNMRRDFTYVDDIAEGVVRVIDRVPGSDPAWNSESPDPSSSAAPYRLYNIGNSAPVDVSYVIELLEKATGTKAVVELEPMQPGDVPATYADVADLEREIGFRPETPIEEGVARFVEWYTGFYKA